MMKTIILVALVGLTSAAHSKESLKPAQIMALSKHTGVCGAIFQMINFQKTTQMSGGDEFVERFISAESARLEKTSEEFAEQCAESISKYDRLFKVATEDQ